MARPRIVQLICCSGAGSMSPDTRTPSSSVLLLLQLLDGPLHQLGIHLGGYWLYLQDQPKREHKDKGKAIYRRGKNEIHNTLHYTHKFLHFVMEKYCYSIFWTLSEIMSVCVWCDWMLLIVMSICAVIHWMAVLILVFRVVTPSQLTVSAVWRVMNSQN